jgi:acetylornithine deacetylase/succinyl-diaminopimelate desuccinylase-like protein
VTAVLDETVTHLRRLIRFDTTNPPGNELPLARYLASTLDRDGIDTRLFEISYRTTRRAPRAVPGAFRACPCSMPCCAPASRPR